MLGTSGTVTTIAGIQLGLPRYDRNKVDGCWLDVGDVRNVTQSLLTQRLRGARRGALHRLRARGSRARGMRNSRGLPQDVAVLAAARGRSRLARGHSRAADERGWRLSCGATAREFRASRHGALRPWPRNRGGENPVRAADIAFCAARQEQGGPHGILAKMAGAPAQRSLCRSIEARRIPLARGLQAQGNRRQVPCLETRNDRDRSWRGAGRMEPDRS